MPMRYAVFLFYFLCIKIAMRHIFYLLFLVVLFFLMFSIIGEFVHNIKGPFFPQTVRVFTDELLLQICLFHCLNMMDFLENEDYLEFLIFQKISSIFKSVYAMSMKMASVIGIYV